MEKKVIFIAFLIIFSFKSLAFAADLELLNSKIKLASYKIADKIIGLSLATDNFFPENQKNMGKIGSFNIVQEREKELTIKNQNKFAEEMNPGFIIRLEILF